jgi:alkylation response protein AidB-like acyl-CoA dehydrogenase
MSVDGALRASLRAQAREFAGDVLAHARAVTDPLPTATERYRATRPFYRQMVEAGFLRRLIPQALGGDGTGRRRRRRWPRSSSRAIPAWR